jgi:hypothetical protein
MGNDKTFPFFKMESDAPPTSYAHALTPFFTSESNAPASPNYK